MTDIEEQRRRVVQEVRTWRGTPYHHEGKVRGAGVDCAMLILQSFVGAGLVPAMDVERYTADWHLHRSEEKYLAVVEQHLARMDDNEDSYVRRIELNPNFKVKPADVLVWKIGRTFSHGAIVSDFPAIIHAYFPSQMVEEEQLQKIRALAVRPMRVYSFWEQR